MKNKKIEEDPKLEFNIITNKGNERVYSLFDKVKRKKERKKDVKINAIKVKKRIFLKLIILLAIIIFIIYGIVMLFGKNNVQDDPVIPPSNIQIEDNKPVENIEPVEKEIKLDLDEGKKLISFIKGTVINQNYETYQDISNKNKIKIVMNKIDLKTGYKTLDGEDTLGVTIEEFDQKAKELFGEEINIDYVTIDKYQYNSQNDTYVVLKPMYEGYKEVEIPIECSIKADMYKVIIAYAEGYIDTEDNYVITDKNGDALEVQLSKNTLNSDEKVSDTLKKYSDKLNHYEYQIKKNINGTLKLNTFKKIEE